MSIKQISVFLENEQGSLEDFTALLGKNSIDLIALSIADTTDFGIVRAIVSDKDKALEVLRDKGYTAKLTEVLVVSVPDSPGGLSGALKTLRLGGVSIEYIYSFVRRINHEAIIIFKVDKLEEAEGLLNKAGFHTLAEAEITGAAKPC